MIEQFKAGSVTFDRLDDNDYTIFVEEGTEEAKLLVDEASRIIEAAGLDKAEKVAEQAELIGGDLVFSGSKGYELLDEHLIIMYAGLRLERDVAFGVLDESELAEGLYRAE